MKQKVGIVTFHRALNYGAVLQCYALQQALNKLNVKSEVVDIRNDRVDRKYRVNIPRWGEYSSIKDYIYFLYEFPSMKRKRKDFDAFLRKNIILSKAYYNKEQLESDSESFSFFIAGSDQVWNLGCTDSNPLYFLDFCSKEKRNSYAASIGTDNIPEESEAFYREKLQTFSRISIRERRSIHEIKRVSGKEVEWTLDPTLLLSRNEWLKCAEKINKPSQYILVYQIYDLHNEALNNYIEVMAKRLNLPVVCIGKNRSLKIRNKIEVFPKPAQWITLFWDAEYVITNSFHGTIFSINFCKEFNTGFLIPVSKRMANIRMRDILSYLSLEDRLIQYDDKTKWEVENSIIRWDIVEERIGIMKNKSYNFLEEVCRSYEGME